ncbi:MAG: hypothetical protein PHU38_06215 [Eubacteriales bacterium]|nr:hypothetical protein [Eubacteriales bacterium]
MTLPAFLVGSFYYPFGWFEYLRFFAVTLFLAAGLYLLALLLRSVTMALVIIYAYAFFSISFSSKPEFSSLALLKPEGAKDGTYTVVTWLDDDRFAAQAADSSSLDAEPLPNNELSDQYTIIFSSSQQAFVYASRNDAVSRAILESNIDIELSLIDSDAAKMQISQAMSDLGFLDVSVNMPQGQATAIQTVTANDEAGNRINIAYDLSSKSIIYLELDQLQEQLQ